jgi:hypothetical protein
VKLKKNLSLNKVLPAPKENYAHFFIHCPTNQRICNTYFRSFLNNTNIIWESSFLTLGAPSDLVSWCSMIINIEILLVNFFIYESRVDKKIPLIVNLNYHTSRYRNILLLSPKYRKAWLKWTS